MMAVKAPLCLRFSTCSVPPTLPSPTGGTTSVGLRAGLAEDAVASCACARAAPPDAEAPLQLGRTLFMMRSRFWELPAGRVFSTLLTRFVGARAEALGGTSTQISLASGDGWHPFNTMLQHTCALFVPTEFSQIKFRDMYSMGMPILAPDGPWMLRLLRHMFTFWGQMHAEHASARLPTSSHADASASEKPWRAGAPKLSRRELTDAVGSAAGSWPHAPFYDAMRDSRARLEYWLPLADVHRYPQVALFGSLPDLVEQVVARDWSAVSAKMRDHFSRVLVRNVQGYYQRSLATLLLPDDSRSEL